MKDERNRLELKVTVASHGDPDVALKRITGPVAGNGPGLKLIRTGGPGIDIVSVERADGQPIGVGAEFEEWWSDGHCNGDTEETSEKSWARDAFMFGVHYGRNLNG